MYNNNNNNKGRLLCAVLIFLVDFIFLFKGLLQFWGCLYFLVGLHFWAHRYFWYCLHFLSFLLLVRQPKIQWIKGFDLIFGQFLTYLQNWFLISAVRPPTIYGEALARCSRLELTPQSSVLILSGSMGGRMSAKTADCSGYRYIVSRFDKLSIVSQYQH